MAVAKFEMIRFPGRKVQFGSRCSRRRAVGSAQNADQIGLMSTSKQLYPSICFVPPPAVNSFSRPTLIPGQKLSALSGPVFSEHVTSNELYVTVARIHLHIFTFTKKVPFISKAYIFIFHPRVENGLSKKTPRSSIFKTGASTCLEGKHEQGISALCVFNDTPFEKCSKQMETRTDAPSLLTG